MSDTPKKKKKKDKKGKRVRPTEEEEQQPPFGTEEQTAASLRETDRLVKAAEQFQKKFERKQRDIEALITVDTDEEEEEEDTFSLVPDSFLPTALKVTDPKPRSPLPLQSSTRKPSPTQNKHFILPTTRKANLALPMLRELESICSERKGDLFAAYYEIDGTPTGRLTFGEVWDQSGVISYHLRVTWRLKKGQTVALVLDYGLNYIYTWLGCLRAGVVPLIVAAPAPPDFGPGLTRLNSILHSAAPIALILTDSAVKYWKEEDEKSRKSPTRKMWPAFAKWKAVDKLPKPKPADESTGNISHSSQPPELEPQEGPAHRPSLFQRLSTRLSVLGAASQSSLEGSRHGLPRPSIRESIFGVDEKEPLVIGTAFDEKSLSSDDVACLQATSGSTAEPKIVVVTFQAIFESLKMTQRSLPSVFDSHEDLTGFSWVPPDHHIGLFFSMLCPLISGSTMHYMSKASYEDNPKQWLELLSKLKIGWTVAPDNGYRWVMREFTKTFNSSATIMTTLNLSSLKILLNIGESPKFNTPTKIRKCFVPYLLPRDCEILTGYGLSELIMPVSWLEQNIVEIPSCAGFAMTKRVAVASKASLAQENIAIIVVNPSTKIPVKEKQMGEIWIWSPCLQYLPGYFNDKKLSKRIFHARYKGATMAYLRTGDIGLFKDDHLYICCRKEDVLTTPQGIRFCPPDIEWFVEDAKPLVKPGCVAAFASAKGTIDIALEVFESTKPLITRQVCEQLAIQIPKFTRMEVSSVVAVPHLTLPRTPIGTVQRRHAKRQMLKEEMQVVFEHSKRPDPAAVSVKKPPIVKRNDSFGSVGSMDDDGDATDDEESPVKTKASKESGEKAGDVKTASTQVGPSDDKPKDAKTIASSTKDGSRIAPVAETATTAPLPAQKVAAKEEKLHDPRKEIKKSPVAASQPADLKDKKGVATGKAKQKPPHQADISDLPENQGQESETDAGKTSKPKLPTASKVESAAPVAAPQAPQPVPEWKQKLLRQKSEQTTANEDPAVQSSAADTAAPSQTTSAAVPKWKQKLLERKNTAETIPNPKATDASATTATVPKWKHKLLERKNTATRADDSPKPDQQVKDKADVGGGDSTESSPDFGMGTKDGRVAGTRADEEEGARQEGKDEVHPSTPGLPPAPEADDEASKAVESSERAPDGSSATGDEAETDVTSLKADGEDMLPAEIVKSIAEAEVQAPRLVEGTSPPEEHTAESASAGIDDGVPAPQDLEHTATSAEEPAAPEEGDLENATMAEEGSRSSLDQSPSTSQDRQDEPVSTDEALVEAVAVQDQISDSLPKEQTAVDEGKVRRKAFQSGADNPMDASMDDSSNNVFAGPQVEESFVMTFTPPEEEEEAASNTTEMEVDKILSRYLGPDFDNEAAWEESGLTSTASVPMRADLESAFLLTLPPDYQGRFPTPTSLKEHISDTKGAPLDAETPKLETKRSTELSWYTLGTLQAFLMVVMFILFSAPLIPCWLALEYLALHPILFMVLVPIYSGGYSVIVIMSKWLVVGRYEECRMLTPSFAYLRWWFVDRLVSVWEIWVGQFVIDTPWIWLFYSLMGARLRPSCQLAGFVREFDLISIGENTSLKYPCIKCRKFLKWRKGQSGPVMVFRRITISKQATVRGMVSPGVQVEEGGYVEKLCVVPEGAIVNEEELVTGNPAYLSDEAGRRDFPCWGLVGFFKVFWLFSELAIMYGIWEGALFLNATAGAAVEGSAFYAHCALVGASCVLLSLLSSIVLKFLLVGKRRPGKHRGCCRCYWTDWAADYHFNLVTLPFRFFAGNSRLCNIILILHGMSIDFASKVEMESFPPSKMDLINVKRSFLGKVSFDVKKDGVYYRTNIEDSTIGQHSHFLPDVMIVKTLIRPYTLVNESVIYHNLNPERVMRHSCGLYVKETVSLLLDIFLLGKCAISVFAACMVWILLWDYVSLETCVLICAASLATQGLAWNFLFIILSWGRFLGSGGESPQPFFSPMHWVYLTMADSFQQWSFIRLTYGSPIFSFMAWMAGVSFEGRALYFGERLHDSRLIIVGDKTVIDGATLVGHNNVYDHFTYGRTYIHGTLYERSLILPNSNWLRGTTEGIGPWEAVVPASNAKSLTGRVSLSQATLLHNLHDIEHGM